MFRFDMVIHAIKSCCIVTTNITRIQALIMNYYALSNEQLLIFLGCARQYLNDDKGVNLMKK